MRKAKVRLLRRGALVAVAGLAVAVLGGTALAGHLTSDVKSYTGCLVPKDGVIVKVKEGDAPAGPCTAGMTQVHLSGGDVTAVRTPPGSGLTGGGENGALSLALDAGHSLPQGCGIFEFPMKSGGAGWACADHAAGTGLTTAGTSVSSSGGTTRYSIETDYRVKNTPDCTAGQFATGFDSSGTIQCGAPSTTLQTFSAVQEGYSTGGKGLPDDGAYHVFASVSVPAGTYLATAKAIIGSEGNVDDFSSTECRIVSGATVLDDIRYGSVQTDDNPHTTFALSGAATVAAGTVQLACSADSGADGLKLSYGRLTVVKVG